MTQGNKLQHSTLTMNSRHEHPLEVCLCIFTTDIRNIYGAFLLQNTHANTATVLAQTARRSE